MRGARTRPLDGRCRLPASLLSLSCTFSHAELAAQRLNNKLNIIFYISDMCKNDVSCTFSHAQRAAQSTSSRAVSNAAGRPHLARRGRSQPACRHKAKRSRDAAAAAAADSPSPGWQDQFTRRVGDTELETLWKRRLYRLCALPCGPLTRLRLCGRTSSQGVLERRNSRRCGNGIFTDCVPCHSAR